MKIMRLQAKQAAVPFLLVAVFLIFSATSVRSQTFTTLYSFSGTGSGNTNSDGAKPEAGLLSGTDGNFYGTTWTGGTAGNGIVFKITPSGSFTVLHTFGGTSGTDGANPNMGLVSGTDGNFYGTTYHNNQGAAGGTVFKITPSGTFTLLHTFAGGSNDGDGPAYGALATGGSGNFFGATQTGVSNPFGILYKITSGGTFTLLHKCTVAGGSSPLGGLIQAGDDNFYGTTTSGGTSGTYGTLFEITPSGSFISRYSFTGGSDGAGPQTAPCEGSDFSLYGTSGNPGGGGDITYRYLIGSGSFVVVANNFSSTSSGTIGSIKGAFMLGTDGNLYGASSYSSAGNGSIFEFVLTSATSGNAVVLYTFSGTSASGTNSDGAAPWGSLVQGSDHNFYGTTTAGGANGNGTVFKLAVSGSLQVTILPAGAVGAGARWRVDGGALQASGATVGGLSIGYHTVTFSGLSGWTAPPSQAPIVSTNQLTQISGTYTGVPWTTTVTGTTNYTTSSTIPLPPTTVSGPYTYFSYNNHGTVNVQADTTIGSGTAAIPWWGQDLIVGPWILHNGGLTSDGDGSTAYTGAVFNVGDPTHNVILTLSDVNVAVKNYAGNTFNIAAGSTMSLVPNLVTDGTTPNSHSTYVFIEGGTMNLSGTILFEPEQSLGALNLLQLNLFTNDGGTVTISSSTATIACVQPSYVPSGTVDPSWPPIVNESGTINGSGTLTYLNIGGPACNNIPLFINYGTVTAGTGSTPGKIQFNNLNLLFGSWSTLGIKLGGTGAGQFDTVTLGGGTWNFEGPIAVNVSKVSGFTPVSGQAWQVVNYPALAPGSIFSPSSVGSSITSGYSFYLFPTNAILVYGTWAPYKIWQHQLFTPAQLSNSGISGDTASPAGDGISNLMKYALGLNPFQSYGSTSVGYPSMGTTTSGTNEYLTLTFTGSASDVSYIVQAAGNPGGAWTPIYTSGTGNPPGTMTVSDTVPMSAATKRFMQLQVIGQ